MGFGSVWHWVVVLVIVLLLFGTKKLKNVGADLGHAIRGFKDAVKEGESKSEDPAKLQQNAGASSSTTASQDRQSS